MWLRGFRFGDFELDPDVGELRRGDSRVVLPDQPLRILRRLLERPGELVTRDEFRQELWPGDTFVDFEHGLNAAVRRLRAALGDEADLPRFIETVPRRGYRFVAAVTRNVERSSGHRLAPRVLGVAALLLIVLAAGLWLVPHRRRTEWPSPIGSIAVLPFKNLTGDSTPEYFVSGLTESISAELARATSLRVVSGATMAHYTPRSARARDIAAELDVDFLLEGTVARERGNVRVTVDLVDPGADRRIWSATYDRKLVGLLDIYAEIAAAVSGELRGPARLDASRRSRRTVVPAAYDLYLQGIFFRRQWQAGGCLTAERYFSQAVALDPEFADAYTQLAFCYAQPDRMQQSGVATGPKARAAVARALALDPDSALAHAMNGRIALVYDYDWATSDRECQEALRRSPDAQAYVSCGELLYLRGQGDEGLALMREGLSLDPLNLDQQVAYGFGLRSVRRFDAAIEQLRRSVDRDPAWASARFWLAYTYGDAGRQNEAVSEYQSFLAHALVPRRVGEITSALAAAYGQSGWQAFWEAEAAVAEEDLRTPGSVWRSSHSYYAGPFAMARRYARIGDAERAFEWLERAYEYRHHLMVFIDREPLFDPLQGAARFDAIRQRIGLSRPPAFRKQ